ncbi:hypothetical protein NHN26_00240 [Rhodovulum tesquicola]|uniref:hypothetical protein n=1 Tax=Rhodovulum tesquicola TaxID=540254 RepID=UPI0020985CAE|nr:hypothetical protein [Rhodovulum tesquicola]MCO8143638.1 hypothetical protein [Rhodovulum tesquicola]
MNPFHPGSRPRLAVLVALVALVALSAGPTAGQATTDAFAGGPLRPKVDDLGAYRLETHEALARLMSTAGDPCVANVAASLFLDAHLAETGLLEQLRSVDRPAEAIARIATIFALPDAAGIGGNIASMLGHASIGAALNLVSVGQNTLKSYDVLVEHSIGSLEQRQAIWTQEIVQKSIDYKWDPKLVSDRSRQLADRGQVIVAEMQDLGDRTEVEILKLEQDFRAELERLERRKGDRIDALREALGGPRDLAGSRQLEVFEKEYKDGEQTAISNRYAKLTAITESYERSAGQLIEDLARNATQQEALARYAWPIARGECAQITREGKAAAIPRLPTGLEEPYERDAADAGRLADVLKLPHDKLMVTLEALVLQPSTDFLSCVCHAAAYGRSHTAQFYHPDTLGEYDKRYACNKPGDPCIVSGYGCMRYPLPSDPKYWERCAAQMQGEAGQSFTDAILSRMKSQVARFQEAPK